MDIESRTGLGSSLEGGQGAVAFPHAPHSPKDTIGPFALDRTPDGNGIHPAISGSTGETGSSSAGQAGLPGHGPGVEERTASIEEQAAQSNPDAGRMAAMPGAHGRKLEQEAKGERVNLSTLRRLLEQQQYRCALTGRPLKPDDVQLDHVDPLSQSGNHTIGNAQLVVSEVNRAKGTMSNEAFIKLCRDVVRTQDASR